MNGVLNINSFIIHWYPSIYCLLIYSFSRFYIMECVIFVLLCNTHLYLDLVFLKILSCQIKCILLFLYIHKNTKGKLFTWLLRQYIRKKVVVVRFGYLMLTQIKQACFLLECIGLVKSELR